MLAADSEIIPPTPLALISFAAAPLRMIVVWASIVTLAPLNVAPERATPPAGVSKLKWSLAVFQ